MMQLVIGQTALRAMQEDRQKAGARTAVAKAQAQIEASARKGRIVPGEKGVPAKERAKAKARRARRQETQGPMPRRARPLAGVTDRTSLD